MRMFRAGWVVIAWVASAGACRNEAPTAVCNPDVLVTHVSYAELLTSLPARVVEGLTKAPTAEGALGRNREGYFHVRFQMDIGYLAAYAIAFKSDAALAHFALAAEYAFQHQLPNGDFALAIPQALENLGAPTEGDLASGTAFFLSALGSSLVALQQSGWFHDRVPDELTQRIAHLRPGFQQAVDHLKTKKDVLLAYDALAPNRLLFDAVAFYAMGSYLGDQDAQRIGLDFAERAVAQQHPDGYFIEGGGFDSSYNGVALRLGFVQLALMPADDALAQKLQQALARAVHWQTTRVLSSGEISAEGNTRVYPGGEDFLGEEKQMAWVETLISFYFASVLSEQSSFVELAERIETHYVR